MADLFADGERPSASKFNQLRMKPIVRADKAALRLYDGPATEVQMVSPSGAWRRDDADTTSPDNGTDVLVDALGRRWKTGAINPADIELGVDLVAIFEDAME